MDTGRGGHTCLNTCLQNKETTGQSHQSSHRNQSCWFSLRAPQLKSAFQMKPARQRKKALKRKQKQTNKKKTKPNTKYSTHARAIKDLLHLWPFGCGLWWSAGDVSFLRGNFYKLLGLALKAQASDPNLDSPGGGPGVKNLSPFLLIHSLHFLGCS